MTMALERRFLDEKPKVGALVWRDDVSLLDTDNLAILKEPGVSLVEKRKFSDVANCCFLVLVLLFKL